MRWPEIPLGTIIFLSLLSFSCQQKPTDANVRPASTPNVETPTEDIPGQPPFATKEPDKYSAKIVFAFRYDEAASNFVEQTYFVARDGSNRRLDFEAGDKQISSIQRADGKQILLLSKQKVWVELNAAPDKNDLKMLTNQPDDFSLTHFLSAKPVGATFSAVGKEEVLNRQTTKYQLDFGPVTTAENIRTETFVWADESLGLPIRTEIDAIENGAPTGAQNIVELREIKTEVEPQIFDVPAGFRKITTQEARQILKQK